MQSVRMQSASSQSKTRLHLTQPLPALAERPDLIFELLDAMPVAAFWKDRDGRFLGGNRFLLDTLGVADRSELIGRCDHDFHRKAEADRYRVDDMLVIESGCEIREGHEMQTRGDGTIVLLRTTKLPIRNNRGEVVGVMGFFTELTEREIDAAQFPEPAQERDEALDASVRSMDFELLYQPIFDLRTGAMASAEALLRWSPPGGPLRTPHRFLRYLESSGLIRPVGLWVVDRASRQLADWRATTSWAADLTVSVNISRVQFDSPTLVDDVAARVESAGMDPAMITLEITETAASGAETKIVDKLSDFRSRGFRIAIDDFGVGQSSLSVLYDLPIDIVKIDRSFIAPPAQLGEEPMSARIEARDRVLHAVVELVRDLGLETVVEGVETVEQHDRVRELGCDMAQGYWRARPMPAAEISNLF